MGSLNRYGGGTGSRQQQGTVQCGLSGRSSSASSRASSRNSWCRGRNEPSGFILTTILGIVGAFVATFIGQAVGWYGPNDGAGFIGAIVGADIVLVIWGMISGRRRTTV